MAENIFTAHVKDCKYLCGRQVKMFNNVLQFGHARSAMPNDLFLGTWHFSDCNRARAQLVDCHHHHNCRIFDSFFYWFIFFFIDLSYWFISGPLTFFRSQSSHSKACGLSSSSQLSHFLHFFSSTEMWDYCMTNIASYGWYESSWNGKITLTRRTLK